MSDRDTEFELLEFEQVEAAPGTALLRIAARPGAAIAPGPLTLVISDGPVEHRHEQLPALPGPPDMIRVAFSAPLEHVGPGVAYALELPGGRLIRLPAPSRRPSALTSVFQPEHGPAGARPVASGPPAGGQDASRLAEAEERAESRRIAIVELERRLQGERERRAAAELDVAHLRAERDEARSQRDTALSERDAAFSDREQAEARARVSAASAGTFEAQVRAATDAAASGRAELEAQLADRTAEVERMRTVAELAQARAQTSRREAAELDEQLARAQSQITVLRQSIEERDAERARVVAAMEEIVATTRAELTTLQERVHGLEEELEAARDAGTRRDAQHAYDLETAQARLDVAQAEMEVARTEADALRHRSAELEATLAELDAALAQRGAEIELLRGVVTERGTGAVAEQTPGLIASSVELETLLADVRAEAFADASATLLAEIEVLRAQVMQQRLETQRVEARLTDALKRADTAEAGLVARTRELEQFGARLREQIKDLQRSREELITAVTHSQGLLEQERGRAAAAEAEIERIRAAAEETAGELRQASSDAEQAHSEAEQHERRAQELAESLSSAQKTLREARDAIGVHESRNRELADAVRAETEKRIRAEEALVTATANHTLIRETLALEASRNRPSLR